RHGEESARRELYQAQCNDAYWHGVFGGLYLPHLRRAVYQKLVSAWSRLKLSPGWEKEDFDLDGRPEFFLQHEPFALWFKTDRGAAITELDYLPGKTNLTDCLTRRVEFYHLYSTSHGESGEGKSIHELPRALSEEVKKWLKFDNYQRFSFLERVYPEGLTRDFYESDYAGTPGPFIEKAFEVTLDGLVLAAERSTEIITGQGVARIRLRKKIMPLDRGLEFAYEIENQEENPLCLTFVSEWNLALFENEYRLEKNKVIFHDNKLELQAEEAAEVWDFPVKTVSQSEKDFEIITQGISFHLVWPLKLQPHSKRTLTVKLRERSNS
ncbi:MAG: alpha-amylase/4-alpha-glucanotransferase domain-containing protein, partial [Candidatus Saccharicenans sp.]